MAKFTADEVKALGWDVPEDFASLSEEEQYTWCCAHLEDRHQRALENGVEVARMMIFMDVIWPVWRDMPSGTVKREAVAEARRLHPEAFDENGALICPFSKSYLLARMHEQFPEIPGEDIEIIVDRVCGSAIR